MMSSGEESEVSEEGDWDSAGTIGFDGAASGAWANVVEYKEEKGMKSRRENKTKSFIFYEQLQVASEGSRVKFLLFEWCLMCGRCGMGWFL